MGREILRAPFFGLIAAVFACCAVPGQETGSSSPKELFEHGQRSLSAGRYEDAERDFKRLLDMGLRSAPVYTNLGVVYMRTGKLESAIRVLKKAKDLAPGMSGVDLNLGLAYYREREFKLAVPYFDAVLSVDPASLQARYLKGTCHFMMDEFAAAVSELAPLQDRERNDLEYLFMLGISYGKLKRAEDARQAFVQLIQAGGDTPHLHLLLGKAYLALDDFSSAQTQLENAAAGNSRLPYSHYYLGVLYDKLGKLDAAAIQFRKETEISPNDPWAYEDFTRIKLSQGDPGSAISLLEIGVARNPAAPILLSALAKAYLEKAEPARAIPHLRRAIELEPGNGGYHYQLGLAYAQSGREKEAKAEMAKARELQAAVLKGQMELLSRDRVEDSALAPAPPVAK